VKKQTCLGKVFLLA